MKKIVLSLILGLSLLFPSAALGAKAPPTGSISLQEVSPYTYGQNINAIGTYSAIPQSRQPQYPNQPQAQLNCWQTINGYTYGLQEVQGTSNKTSLGSSTFQSSYPFVLSGGDTISGPLFCSLIFGYFNEINGIPTWHQLGYMEFNVN